jgi:hypothetical protein
VSRCTEIADGRLRVFKYLSRFKANIIDSVVLESRTKVRQEVCPGFECKGVHVQNRKITAAICDG